jgi:hypothetical protein
MRPDRQLLDVPACASPPGGWCSRSVVLSGRVRRSGRVWGSDRAGGSGGRTLECGAFFRGPQAARGSGVVPVALVAGPVRAQIGSTSDAPCRAPLDRSSGAGVRTGRGTLPSPTGCATRREGCAAPGAAGPLLIFHGRGPGARSYPPGLVAFHPGRDPGAARGRGSLSGVLSEPAPLYIYVPGVPLGVPPRASVEGSPLPRWSPLSRVLVPTVGAADPTDYERWGVALPPAGSGTLGLLAPTPPSLRGRSAYGRHSVRFLPSAARLARAARIIYSGRRRRRFESRGSAVLTLWHRTEPCWAWGAAVGRAQPDL